jgi:ligand-binding sensor domain-containing protein
MHNPLNPTSLSYDYVQYILKFKDRHGQLWISTYGGGLDLLNKDNETFTLYRYDPKNSSSISYNTILLVYEDPEAKLWVATTNGLNLMDRKTRTFTTYFINPVDTTSGGSNFTIHLLKDKHGKFWVVHDLACTC